MDELATKLVDSLTKVETALETMAPTAFQALVEAAAISGILGLVGLGTLLFVALIGVGSLLLGMMKWESKPENYHTNDTASGLLLGGGASGGLFLLIFIVILLDSQIVLKVLNPTAYVIKSLLNQ